MYCIFDDMELKREIFTEAINNKMHTIMFDRKEKLGLRHFAEEIGVSLATLSRVLNKPESPIELKTMSAICNWLDKPISEYFN